MLFDTLCVRKFTLRHVKCNVRPRPSNPAGQLAAGSRWRCCATCPNACRTDGMHFAEITRAETAQRAALLRVDSYDVELDLTGGAENFRSTSVIVFECAQHLAATYADLIAEGVHEITLNGASLDPAAVYAQGRIALTGLAARNELRVIADCGYAGDGSGLMRTQDSADGRIYLSTQFEAAGARKVFACFEQPDLKAEFTFHVRAAEPSIVVSNQPAGRP